PVTTATFSWNFGIEILLQTRAGSPRFCLHRHNNLPELASVLQIAVHVPHVIELERAIDDGLERAALEAFEDKFHRSLSTCLIPTRKPDIVPLDGRHLGDHLQHRQRGDTLAERSV